MDKKYLWFAIFGISIISLIFAINAFGVSFSNLNNGLETSLKHQSQVCIQVTDSGGNVKSTQCTHNIYFSAGANSTAAILGNGATYGPFQNVTICNATAGSANCVTPFANGSGLETFTLENGCGFQPISAGNYTALVTPGNWTINKTFTSTCDGQSTNVSRLTNSTGGLFAGASFTTVTLMINDQLSINWTIWNS